MRDEIVEKSVKLLSNITHSNSHFASTKRCELPATRELNLSGAIAGDLLFEPAPEIEQTRRIILVSKLMRHAKVPPLIAISRRLHTQVTGDAPGAHAGFESEPIFS